MSTDSEAAYTALVEATVSFLVPTTDELADALLNVGIEDDDADALRCAAEVRRVAVEAAVNTLLEEGEKREA